jgi:hypothetical protein
MVPHVLGYFPMAAAWVILIVHLEWARNDLALITDRTIPEWVDGAVSCMLISPHATTIHDLFVLCYADLRHRNHLLVIFWRPNCVPIPAARCAQNAIQRTVSQMHHFLQPLFQSRDVRVVAGYYWGSELIYCVLSLTAKLYLGFFLLINVRSPNRPCCTNLALTNMHFACALAGHHDRWQRRGRAGREQSLRQTKRNSVCQGFFADA